MTADADKYLDPNGFVVGFLEVVSKNYVYVIDASEPAKAKVLFPDGTVAKIDVDGTIEKFNGTLPLTSRFETARFCPGCCHTLTFEDRQSRPASPPAWTIRTPLSTRWT